MKVHFSARFQNELADLVKRDPSLKKRVTKTLGLLRINPIHPSLRLHKMFGTRVWSVSVNMRIRILYTYNGDIQIHRIGSHDEVY